MDEQRLKQIESDVQELKSHRQSINRLTGEYDKKLYAEILEERILDVVWDRYFYFLSYFESEEGWDVASAEATPVTGSGLTLQTTTTSGNRSSAFKNAKFQQVLTFDQQSRFRTNLVFGLHTTTANIECSLSVGSGLITPLSNRYGFRVEGNVLYGICSDGTTERKIALQSFPAGQGDSETFPILLEARFYPRERVDFYTSDFGFDKLIRRAVLSDKLPTGVVDAWINLDLITRTTTAKTAFIDFFEYIQVRPNR